MSAPFLTPAELDREARELRNIDTPIPNDQPSRGEIRADAAEDDRHEAHWPDAA